MKAIIQSYTPQECRRIINGRQTIKVCKTAPEDTPFKVYMYCTKDGYAYRCRIDENGKLIPELWNGKVIGEYVCEKVDKYRFSNYEAEYDVTHDEMSRMWLNHPNLIKYGKGKTLRGLHISSLKIYDKPKELSEFRPCCEKLMTGDLLETSSKCNKIFFDENGVFYVCGLTRPPHGWQYVEDGK